MKIAIGAFLFAERDMEVNHKKSSEERSLYFVNDILLISETSHVDEVVKIKSKTQHKTVTTIILDIGKT